ncbi:stage III sporulation protein SpoIIIAB [Evansella cellulosilytica]|uniref:Stage III sporulation protein AB n=1 Tax=Evansella cellulosilytica (strain ATCC 21833 / DSM 2522 / FERM P-1141 / JCM 9156 / N-4) TaxID=649639 RepID=E6TXN9_EVAC2|nr:stage III sporulation protein SpoIIIAB [Evansella cellulosilytica]ADU29965.1 stage III sporulation protein AB [Evansella cellulosilytica DSM 2522]
MKLLGALLIIATTTMFGWEFSRRLTRRTKQIRYLKIAFEALETEMTFSMTPLPDACEKVAHQLIAPLNIFFEDVAERLKKEEKSATSIWNSSLKKWKGKTDLNTAELNILNQFGQTLGQQDLESQRKQIRLAISYFNQEEKQALEDQQKFESMYKSLGFLGGVLLVLIML